MSAANFLDSNVFIYLFDDTDDAKRQRAETLVRTGLANGSACISFQVVQEVMNVLLRKLGVSLEDARAFLYRTLVPLWRVKPTADFYRILNCRIVSMRKKMEPSSIRKKTGDS